MHPPTHEEISKRAHQLWEDSGRPAGDGTEHWLAAERELTSAAKERASAPSTEARPAPQPLSEGQSTHAAAERAAQQRKEARVAIVPNHVAPRQVPAPTGKPLWNQPHSS